MVIGADNLVGDNKLINIKKNYEISSSFIYVDGNEIGIPKLGKGFLRKEKLEYLKEFRESTDSNILIFYNFKKEAEAIKQLIKVDYEVSGSLSKIPKFEDFKNLKNKTTLVQIQAGGAGIELQYNSEVIFFSPTWSYQDYEQAIGRAYRIGQKNKVTVYKYI